MPTKDELLKQCTKQIQATSELVGSLQEQVTAGMAATQSLVNEFLTELRSVSNEQQAMKSQVSLVDRSLCELTKEIRGKGPETSLAGRIAFLDRDLGVIRQWREEQKKVEQEARKAKWTVIAAVITSTAALLASIITAVT